MDKQVFISYLQYYEDFESAVRRLEKALGGKSVYNKVELFETDWYQAVDKMLSTFLECHFTEKGLDLIYNKIFNPFVDEYDPETGEELWEELISNREFYFNE